MEKTTEEKTTEEKTNYSMDEVFININISLKNGLENECIKWCVIGLKQTNNKILRNQIESIMISIL